MEIKANMDDTLMKLELSAGDIAEICDALALKARSHETAAIALAGIEPEEAAQHTAKAKRCYAIARPLDWR